jgi:hypothetical protein
MAIPLIRFPERVACRMNIQSFRFVPALLAALVLGSTSVIAAEPAAVDYTRTKVTTQATGSSREAPPARRVAANPAVRRLFCLNMSLQCFALSSSTAGPSAKTLDLRAPDIRQLVPEAELRQRLDEPEEVRETEQVEVEGVRPEIYVPGGLASLPWAVMHPTQAWRIFLPVPTGQAK